MTPETPVKGASVACGGTVNESEGLRMGKASRDPVAKRRKGAGERKGNLR